MESSMFEGSALKGCLNQDFSRPFQNLMHHGSNDGRAFYEPSFSHEGPHPPIHWKGVGSALSPGYNNPNLSCPGFNDRYNICYSQQSSNIDPGGGSSLLVASTGENMSSLMDPKLISGEAVSPEQISSVTACSDAEWYSHKESLEFGATSAVRSFSEPTSGDNLELDKSKAWLPEHISMLIQKNTDALSGMIFSKPEVSHEQLPEYAPQALQSKQFHLQPCQLPAHFDFSLEAGMYGCSNHALSSMTSNNPKLSHEQLFQYAPKPLQPKRSPLHPCQPPAHFDFSLKADMYGCGTDALSSMMSSKPKLSNEQSFQYVPQALQSMECRMQLSPPPTHYDFSLKPEMYGCNVGNQEFQNEVPGGRSSDQPHLSSEQMHRFQQGFCTVQVSRPRNPIQSHNILVSYLKFKSKQLDACRSLQEFLHHLHAAVCRDLICQCEKYRLLISHFEKCQNSDCNLCGPVRQLCHTERNNSIPVSKSALVEKMTSGCGRPRGYLLGDHHPRDFIVQEIQPIPKRLKIENAVPHDNWSLGAAVLPHLMQRAGHLIDDKENRKKMNKELLTSNDGSTKGVIRNVAADNGRSNTENFRFSKTDELLGHGQSPEGPINSATLNKEIPWSIGNFGRSSSTINDMFGNKVLGNNDAFSHSKEIDLIDKNQKMDCINTGKIKTDATFYRQSSNSDGISGLPEEPKIDQAEKVQLISVAEHDIKCDSDKTDYQPGMKLEASKLSGVSLTDFFTAEQIKEHLGSLNQWINPDIETELTGNEAVHTAGANTCQLCAKDGLTFAAPPMYCSSCGVIIKHRLTYYWIVDEMAAQYCFCTLCFNRSRGGNISFKGVTFSKAKLQKGKNIAEFEEAWVQCNKCERWQHQICALYNSKRDLEGTVDYICPICRLAEIEAKGHLSSPPAFGARVLPRTKLSDHIEQRLLRSLEHERKQRAELLGKSPEEVKNRLDLMHFYDFLLIKPK